MPAPNLGASELTPLDRACARGMSIDGMSARQIAPHFKAHHSTISRSLKAYNNDNSYKSASRGRPRMTTAKKDNKLCIKGRANHISRRQPLMELHHNTLPDVSRRTIQRRLEDKDIKKWRAAERPLLESSHKQARLNGHCDIVI